MASGFPLHFLCLWSCKRALGNGILSLTFFTQSPLPPWPNKNQLGENRTPCGMNLYFLKLKLCLNYFPRSIYRINTNFQNTFCYSCSFSFLIRFLSINSFSVNHLSVCSLSGMSRITGLTRAVTEWEFFCCNSC